MRSSPRCAPSQNSRSSGVGVRPQVVRRLAPVGVASCDVAHVGSVPSTTVPCVDSQPPLPCATAISAPGTCASPASPRSWRVASHNRNRPRMPGCVADSPPPSVFVGSAPPSRRLPVGDERPALALRREAEVLEHDEHGVGERVVHREHVDVGGRDAGFGERLRARSPRPRSRSCRPWPGSSGAWCRRPRPARTPAGAAAHARVPRW